MLKSIEDYNKQNPNAVSAVSAAKEAENRKPASTVQADGTAKCLNKGCQKTFKVAENSETACRCVAVVWRAVVFVKAGIGRAIGSVVRRTPHTRSSLLRTCVQLPRLCARLPRRGEVLVLLPREGERIAHVLVGRKHTSADVGITHGHWCIGEVRLRRVPQDPGLHGGMAQRWNSRGTGTLGAG